MNNSKNTKKVNFKKQNLQNFSILSAIIGSIFIINPLSHFFQNVLGIGNTFFVGYICWILLFITVCVSRYGLLKYRFFLVLFLLFSFVVGSIRGGIYLDNGLLSNLHAIIIVCMAVMSTSCFKFKRSISKEKLVSMLRIIVFFGVIGCLYAIIAQYDYVKIVLKDTLNAYSWKLVSFFRQRNIFAGYCFIATIAACYVYMVDRKVRTLFCILLFGILIFLTNSRASLLAYAICVGLCILYSRRNKFLFFIFAVIVIFLTLYTFNFFEYIILKSTHINNDVNSTEERIKMWKSVVRYLSANYGFICGFGLGSTSNFLEPVFGVGSAHNQYFDALFTGGIVYVFVILQALVKSFVKVYKSVGDKSFSTVWKAAIISYAVYSCFESGAALFASGYFSTTITILLIMIPDCYAGISVTKT